MFHSYPVDRCIYFVKNNKVISRFPQFIGYLAISTKMGDTLRQTTGKWATLRYKLNLFLAPFFRSSSSSSSLLFIVLSPSEFCNCLQLGNVVNPSNHTGCESHAIGRGMRATPFFGAGRPPKWSQLFAPKDYLK
ncbi:hypothetical protein ACFFRR_006367 [Megaselia abdita]